MAYRIVKRAEYFYPVSVDVVQDGGAVLTFDFNAKFKRLSDDQITEIRTAPGKYTDRDVVMLVLVGWDGVLDESGQPLPFNPDTVDALLRENGVPFSIASAWFASINKELRKN